MAIATECRAHTVRETFMVKWSVAVFTVGLMTPFAAPSLLTTDGNWVRGTLEIDQA